MAYVPSPIQHDLFLSYSHEDAAWVTALQEQLTERLLHRLGYACEVWQDANKLRTGQHVTAELERAIAASAAFIAIVSRNYQHSKWCALELETFLNEAARAGAMETGGYLRVLKVIKFPWLLNAHEGFLADYQHVPFFAQDPKTGQEREFQPSSSVFRKAVDTLSFHIEKLFEAMLRGAEKVFVARVPGEAAEEREAMIREIRAAGFALSPPPEGAIPPGLDRRTLLKYVADARVTVHLLGAAYDRSTREQIDLSLEAGKKCIFCLIRGYETAGGEQKALIDEIRENKRGLPDGAWSLLESRSAAAIRQDLIGLLRPAQAAVSPAPGAAPRVYLMCDPTSADAAFAREIQTQIRDRENFQVELPQAAADSSAAARHERLLDECDGLLLYHDKAPALWYKRNFKDLVVAEDRARERELRSKALLVSVNNVAIPGMVVLQRHDPFDLQQIEPFLAPLRHLSAAGDAVHAGS